MFYGFFVQAKLHEIITSEAKAVQNNGCAEYPWMVDGAGLPPNAFELLPRMVFLFICTFVYILLLLPEFIYF